MQATAQIQAHSVKNWAIDKRTLLEITEEAKEIQQALNMPEIPINQIIVEQFYRNDLHDRFKSREQWAQCGYMVKPSSEGFPIWGQHRQPKAIGQRRTRPVLLLYSNSQVRKMKI